MNLSWRKVLRIVSPFALGYFLSYLYRTVNAVIAPDLVRDLGLNPATLGLLTGAYFLAFAAAQLPLGLLLDRFGPRRVEASLLLIAAAGAMVFARAESVAGVMVGRAMIGLGVSACLMAAFKAFTLWFPPQRLPLINSVQMVSGGLGALAASSPVQIALEITDWRGVFTLLAGLTLFAALAIFWVVPEQHEVGQRERFAVQLEGLKTIMASRAFWRITPWAVAAQSAYLSLPGLWAGPWLRDVAGYPRMAVAKVLMGVSLAMMAGYFSFGVLADYLTRRGIPLIAVAAAGMLAFMGVQLLLIVPCAGLSSFLWMLFGFFGTACILPYAVLSQSFAKPLSGRANTALNVLVFSAAFIAQWGVGVVVGCWPLTASGGYQPAGYQTGFSLLLVLQVLAALWFLRIGKKSD
ncbi:MAG: MFS transporter [Desulfuromonas sp.]|nr:MAG: MFS transporter [Desulfuromonas sp.]